MIRLYNLDYLRGLAAFGIMIYHYLTWTLGHYPAGTFMARVGIYGVSIFYVLSGLTLYYVYYDKMKPSRKDVADFFKKRVFRIFPLLWIVTFAGIILSRKIPDFFDVFLNLTGLFGFVKWDTYFSTGVWSIGNELVFYAFFPFFVLFAKSYRPLFVILSALLFLIYLYFAFVVLDPEKTMLQQRSEYINPLNQVFLFLGGFLTGMLFQKTKINPTLTFTLLLSALVCFIFIPTPEDTASLVTGTNRLIFTFCCFLICFAFYKLTFKLPAFIHKPLTLLGEASYSVYLIHPLVWALISVVFKLFEMFLFSLPVLLKIPLGLVLTLLISYLTYEYFEKFFMRLGRRTQNKSL